MAGVYLLIIHDHAGIKAMIIDKALSGNKIQDRSHIFFKDLADPSGASPGLSASDPPIGAAMDQIATDMDLKGCSDAILLFSPGSVYFRTMGLPFRSEKKIQQVLPFELEPVLPTGTETYVSDFQILDYLDDQTLILAASLPEPRIEAYFNTLGTYGIRLRIISLSGYFQTIAFLKDHPRINDAVFLYVLEDKTALILIHDRSLWAFRSLPRPLASPDPETPLALAIHQTITGFRQKTGKDIHFDLIIGFDQGVPQPEGFPDKLEKALQHMQSPIAPGLDSQIVGLSVQTLVPDEWLTVITPDDAAVCKINFCKGKYSSASFLKTYFYPLAAAIALFFFAAGLGIFSISLDNSNLNKQIRLLDNTAMSVFINTFPDQKRVLDPYLQMKANVRELMKKAGKPGDKTPGLVREIKVMDVLAELSEKLPPALDVEISSFLLNSGRLVFSGSTDNFNTVDKIKTGLESSGFFKTVDISSAAADKKGDRVNFKFNIDL